MTINDHVRHMRAMTPRQKHEYLQELIGPPSDDADVLQFRALLVTALNEAKIWPPQERAA